jgi:hypothetical protein
LVASPAGDLTIDQNDVLWWNKNTGSEMS